MTLQGGALVHVRVGAKSVIVCTFQRRGVCRGPTCGAEILWCRTPNGRPIPVSVPADGDEDGVAEFEPHFADCPDERQFRKTEGE